ncbi:sulfotransferase [Candidatus Roizmanbacteria bacterium]|nr:sulfotransferase [Candidatus Roizmanbacteria bacterium]
MSNIKPRLIVGGASKSGTTALFYYLRQHPDICLSAKKELHFFSRICLEQTSRGPGDRYVLAEIPNTFDEYMSFFNHCNGGKIAIDISPSYLYHYESADMIKTHLGEVKIVFILRNPVEKAFSQYMHLVGEGREKLGFEDALAKEDEREVARYSDMWLYKRSGFFADAIDHFFKVFGRDNVKVVFFEEFLSDPQGILHEICLFSGIDGEFRFEPVYDVNRSGHPKSALLAKLIAPNSLTYFLRRIIPQGIGRIGRKLIKDWNVADKPKLSDDIRSLLLTSYIDDIRRLELTLGRKSGWISKQDLMKFEDKE